MTIETQTRDGVTILKLAGDLTSSGERPLLSRVAALLGKGVTRVVMDVSEISFVNSGGLGELVQITARANAQNARVMLASPSPFLAGVLQTTRLDRFFEVAATIDAAVAMLQSLGVAQK